MYVAGFCEEEPFTYKYKHSEMQFITSQKQIARDACMLLVCNSS